MLKRLSDPYTESTEGEEWCHTALQMWPQATDSNPMAQREELLLFPLIKIVTLKSKKLLFGYFFQVPRGWWQGLNTQYGVNRCKFCLQIHQKTLLEECWDVFAWRCCLECGVAVRLHVDWVGNICMQIIVNKPQMTDMRLLTHWGRVTHLCVGNRTTIGPDNGLSPGRRQAIIWTNAGILLIGPWGTNFSEILIGIQIFSFKKIHLKITSAKWRLFCLGLNVLRISSCAVAISIVLRGFIWYMCSYPSSWSLHWHWDNYMITPEPVG